MAGTLASAGGGGRASATTPIVVAKVMYRSFNSTTNNPQNDRIPLHELHEEDLNDTPQPSETEEKELQLQQRKKKRKRKSRQQQRSSSLNITGNRTTSEHRQLLSPEKKS